ncbi:hypothetical protein FUAX_20980 [Fulvitalea axinellae]|uniref:Lipopolysaccharide-assembly n=1 Tax=Fulvitalea axinellae TaxID=1182444 RepID=A0AAU9CBX5_9BACT|nr:hypothetical protein FUAX_20980 [Fulvitalea axinellae]
MKLKTKAQKALLYTGKLFLLVAFCLAGHSCGVYSFTGASIDYTNTKTISIGYFYNEAGLGPANISDELTNKLKDFFQQNTQLDIVAEDGDLQIEGTISRYAFSPLAPQSNPNATSGLEGVDEAGLERLTIGVSATYVNVNDETYDFENRVFSQFEDYNAVTQTREQVETGLVDGILDQIVLDIFNASVANW